MNTIKRYTRNVGNTNSEIHVIVDSKANLITVELHITGYGASGPAVVLDLTPPEAAQLADMLPRALRFRRLFDRRGRRRRMV